jgi:hypothetical protein
MRNYFNYFTEIEERFQQRRGSLLMLSTLDWALIETWRESGVPLEAVLNGIDSAFDKHDAKAFRSARKTRKVNGLAWCAQSVMEAVEQVVEASVGAASVAKVNAPESGFENDRVSQYLEQNATAIKVAILAPPADATAAEISSRLRSLVLSLSSELTSLEELDRTLCILEEKMFAALMTSASEEELVALRGQAAKELAPYRGRMQAMQIKQVQQQFLQKRLFEARKLPRLSLFYMSHG